MNAPALRNYDPLVFAKDLAGDLAEQARSAERARGLI